MGRAAMFRSAAGIVAFIVLMLSGLALALMALLFATGAPHAFPSLPGIAAALFLVALLLVWAGVTLLRRSIHAAALPSGTPDQARRRLYVAAGGALLLVVGAAVFPFVYAPRWPAKGSVQRGVYVVEPTLMSSCAENAHRIFYKKRVVTKVAQDAIVSPRNASRLLYTVACANNQSESGVFYFDGSLAAPVQANPLALLEIPPDMDLYWSPDDKFVVVPSYSKSTLLNLETGHRSEYLSELFAKKDAFSSSASFLGWSPDGKQMAMRVHSSYWVEDRSLREESGLISVNPATLIDTYVAEMPASAAIAWVIKNGTYEPAVAPAVTTSR